MRITKLELTNFGKFHNKTIFLHDGCNLIYGPNEAGKTTIHTFIYGMFFGLDPSRGRGAKNSLYARYLPWDTPGQYDGKLWFEKNGCTFRIERCFLKEQRQLHLINETHGSELEPAAERLSALLAPLNEVLFRNTLLIRQMQVIPDEDLAPQLENYTANLNMTRNASIDISAARDELNEKKRALRRTLHPEALQEKMKLEDQCTQLERERTALVQQLEEQEQKLSRLAEQISAKQTALLQETTSRAADTPQKKTPEPAEPAAGKSFPRLPAILCYLACLLCVIAAGLFLITSQYTDYLLYPLCAGWFFLIAALLLDRLRSRRSRRNAVPEADKTAYEALYPDSAAAPADAMQETAVTAHSTSDSEPKPTAAQEGAAAALSAELASLQAEQEQQIREQTRLQLELAQKKDQSFDAESAIGVLTETLAQDHRTDIELQALELAVSRLEQLSGQIHHSYGIDLNAEASQLLSQLTEGRYRNMVLNADLHITLNTEQKLVSAEQLSRGTLEQIYFCLRIAAARMLSSDEPFPFLLDDIFVFYDEERLRAALKLLTELNTQVILFSCHKREQDIMKELTSVQ